VVLAERRPSLNIVLEIPADELMQRIEHRSQQSDRFESRPGLAERTVAAFATVVGIPGDRIIRIDGTSSSDDVEAMIRREVTDVLR